MATQSPTEWFADRTFTTLKDRGLTVGWLAHRIGEADSTVRYQLANPDALKFRVAHAISNELGVPLGVEQA